MEKEIYTVEEVIVDEILVKDKCGAVYKIIGQPGKDGVDGKDGKDGRDGKDGKDGVDGAPGRNGTDGEYTMDDPEGGNGNDSGSYQGMFYATIYKSSVEKPARPTGGSYDFEEFTLEPPTDWTTSVSSDARNVWMSSRHFYPDGTEEDWSEPIRLIMSPDELLDGANTLLRVVTIYTSNDSKPSLPTWSVSECGMDKAAWDNAIDKGEYPNFEIPQGDPLGWSLELPSSGLIWQSTNSFHSDGTLMGWTGPYKYVDIDGILDKATKQSEEAAKQALEDAEKAVSDFQKQVTLFETDLKNLRNEIDNIGSSGSGVDLDDTQLKTWFAKVEALETQYSELKLTASNLSSQFLDALYTDVTSISLGKGEKTEATLVANLTYMYTLQALVDKDSTAENSEKVTLNYKVSTNETISTNALLNLNYPNSNSNGNTGYYGYTFYNMTDNNKLTIQRTDSLNYSGQVIIKKVLSETMSGIYQTADSIKTTIGEQINGVSGQLTSIQQSLTEIQLNAGVTLYAIDKMVTVSSKNEEVQLSMYGEYYPTVVFESSESTGTASVQFYFNKAGQSSTVYTIDSTGQLKRGDTNINSLSVDELTGLNIIIKKPTNAVIVSFKYHIASAISSLNITPSGIKTIVEETLPDCKIQASQIELLPLEIKAVVTNGTNAASIILGINKVNDSTSTNDSYINLTADQIVADGDLIAKAIATKSLNVDNITYINGSEQLYTPKTEDGKTVYKIANGYVKDAELAAIGLCTDGAARFYADGHGSLAGGLISWARYNYDSNGNVTYNKDGTPTINSEKPMGLYVKGIINATAGQIGGWTIGKINNSETEGYLYSKSQNGYLLQLSPDAIISSLTKDDSTTQMFRLNRDGTGMLAQNHFSWDKDGNVTLNGTVYASAGNIGGWTITKDDYSPYLEAASSDGYIMTISPEAGIFCKKSNGTSIKDYSFALYADGDGSLAFNNITWDASGYITAQNISLTGDITANRLVMKKYSQTTTMAKETAWFAFENETIDNIGTTLCPVLHWKDGNDTEYKLNLATIVLKVGTTSSYEKVNGYRKSNGENLSDAQTLYKKDGKYYIKNSSGTFTLVNNSETYYYESDVSSGSAQYLPVFELTYDNRSTGYYAFAGSVQKLTLHKFNQGILNVTGTYKYYWSGDTTKFTVPSTASAGAGTSVTLYKYNNWNTLLEAYIEASNLGASRILMPNGQTLNLVNYLPNSNSKRLKIYSLGCN